MTDLDESIGVRELSHDTTKVLREIEENQRLVQVTKHGKIVALIIPTSVPSLVNSWLDLNPARAALFRRATGQALPGIATPGQTAATPDDPVMVTVGVKEFAQATSEYLRRAENGDWVLLRRHGAPIALLVRFSLPELVRLSMQRQ